VQPRAIELKGLLKLPPELIGIIGRNLIRGVQGTACGSHVNVFSFALTCKNMYSVLEHILLEDIRIVHRLEATELRNKRLLPLTRAIERELTLGTHLRNFELCLRRHSLMRDVYRGESIQDIYGRESYLAEVTRQCQSFGNFLHAYAPNVSAPKTLYPLGCDLLGRTWPKLETLIVSSMDGAFGTCCVCFKDWGGFQNFPQPYGLNVTFLASALHSPRLKCLSLETTEFKEEEALSNLQPRSIALQWLSISTHGMEGATISALLRTPKALTEFRLPYCCRREPLLLRVEIWDEDSMLVSLR